MSRSFPKFFILAAALMAFTFIGIIGNVRQTLSSKDFWPVGSENEKTPVEKIPVENTAAEKTTVEKTTAEKTAVEAPAVEETSVDISILDSAENDEDFSTYKLENATFVVLAQNSDLDKMKQTVRTYERRFNKEYHYPWTFLNNEDFSDDFKRAMTALVSGPVEFGKIPTEHWSIPSFIDVEKAKESWKKMESEHVIYGGSESYRHMCRFESGFFYRHELMKKYRYYWRVEPDTSLRCTVNYDVFKFMRERNLRYGFTIAVTEWVATIPTLWNSVLEFFSTHPTVISEGSLMDFISNDGGQTYNGCHFWSNFEVADMEVWRSSEYEQFFDALDKSGGFFYERWGDAPVHSIFAATYLRASEIHFFDDIGYSHPPFTHCPRDQGMKELDCDCIFDTDVEFSNDQIDWHPTSCLRTYLNAKKRPYLDGLRGAHDSGKGEMMKKVKERIMKEQSENERADKLADLKAEVKASLLEEARLQKEKQSAKAKAKADAEEAKKESLKKASKDEDKKD